MFEFLSLILLASFSSLVLSKSASSVSAIEWDVLNRTVGGRVHRAAPFSRPCFTLSTAVVGNFNATLCSQVQSEYADHIARSNTFGAYMNTEWESCQATSQVCQLDWTNPLNPAAFNPPNVCSQGSIPPFYIDVREPGDVQAAFAFSKSTGVPLTIKNTGHDYKGRSSLPDSLGLWTHNLRSITYNALFVAQGCSVEAALPAVTMDAGVLAGDLADFADQHNITLPIGADDTVGIVGGYMQGGGHSPVSNTFGLAADRAVQFEIVVPDGRQLVANECQNTDLFFALRGGGGGTFGVVMKATTKALPQVSLTTVLAQYVPTATTQRLLLQFLISNSVAWGSAGWGGIILPSSAILLANPAVNEPEAAVFMRPFQTFVETQLNGTFLLVVEPSYLSFHNTFVVPEGKLVPVGEPLLASTRLIPASTLTSSPDQLLDALTSLISNSVLAVIFATTPFHFKETPGATSVTGAWYSSIWHVSAGTAWPFNTTVAGKEQAYQDRTNIMNPFRTITPGSGAYHNEADVHEPGFSFSFWGDNYAKLVSIKQKYDPDHLLDCWQCVDWQPKSDIFRCYI